MPSQRLTSHPPVPIAMGTGDTRTEEGRAFYQGRLALLGQWICLVSGSFLVFFGGLRTLQGVAPNSGMLFHAISTALAGLVWALGNRARLSMAQMQWVDIGGTSVICASFAAMTVGYARLMLEAGMDASTAIFAGLLATTYTLLARAIAIPSTTARTLLVGLGSMVPLLLAAGRTFSIGEAAGRPLAATFVDVVPWQLGGVAMSVVASRVIFGLRKEVAETRRLGQYTLGEKVGEGGMGVVYRAHHAMLRRPTAIKLLPPEKAGSENIQRFEREVQLTASLTPPQHRGHLRLRAHARRHLLLRDGVPRRHQPRAAGEADGPQPAGAGRAHPASGVRRAGRSAPHRPRPSRHQARQHHPVRARRRARRRQGRRLRPGQALPDRRHRRHARLDHRADPARGRRSTWRRKPPPERAISTPAATSTPLARLPTCSSPALRCFRASRSSKSWRHHLHTQPESLSRRLGRPVPHELEEVILRCLAKQPDDRPSSARALRDRLAHLRDIDDWSDDDASRWWLQHRRVAGAVRASA